MRRSAWTKGETEAGNTNVGADEGKGWRLLPVTWCPVGRWPSTACPGDAPLGQRCPRFMLPMGEAIRRGVVPGRLDEEAMETRAVGQRVTPCTM